MGHYYTKKQYELARPIALRYDFSVSRSPQHPTVNVGERLIGRVDNGLWRAYPDLTQKSEFDHFYNTYAQGRWLSFDVRVASEAALTSKHP